jgi:peroxiredoxin
MLAVGDRAPDFTLPSTGGQEVHLAEMFAHNRATILAFYVLDFTPGWKTELTEFRSRHQQLAADEIAIYGISVDSVFCHQAFAESLGGLPFELIADFERKMVGAYGVRREDVAGYSGMPTRSIFIVDPEGTIRWTWVRSQGMPLPDYDVVAAAAAEVAGRE